MTQTQAQAQAQAQAQVHTQRVIQLQHKVANLGLDKGQQKKKDKAPPRYRPEAKPKKQD